MSTTPPPQTGAAKPRRCPNCGAQATARYFPFCSIRCAEIDLARWLTGRYVIPGVDGEANQCADEPQGDKPKKPIWPDVGAIFLNRGTKAQRFRMTLYGIVARWKANPNALQFQAKRRVRCEETEALFFGEGLRRVQCDVNDDTTGRMCYDFFGEGLRRVQCDKVKPSCRLAVSFP